MSKDWYQDVYDFHKATGQHIEEVPTVSPLGLFRLRRKLIDEEVREVLDALLQDDLVELADGIADSIVVLLGTAVSYGIDMRPVWDEVHQTNMAKVGGPRREDGKQLKPEGWEPPKIKELLVEQGMEDL